MLVRRLPRQGQVLSGVKYFTASVRNDPPALARQNAYIGALRTATSLAISLAEPAVTKPP